MDAALSAPVDRSTLDLVDYPTELTQRMTIAWDMARDNAHVSAELEPLAQAWQKRAYNKTSRPPTTQVGDSVFIQMPAEQQGAKRKLARPYRYHGPYRVLNVSNVGVEAQLIAKPQSMPIKVPWERVTPDPRGTTGKKVSSTRTSSLGGEKCKQYNLRPRPPAQ